MIVELRMLLLGGASVLATAAVFMPSEASACDAVSVLRNGIDAVDIVLRFSGDAAVQPFTTSNEFSDGDGIDTLTMSGGAVLTGAATTPAGEHRSRQSRPQAPASSTCSEGDDIVIISGGTIGTAADPLGIVLGAGADTFRMSGGTITGSVFGLGGGNTYAVSGGRSFSLFAGSQNDAVTISGTATFGCDAAIGPDFGRPEDGDDASP